MLPQPPAKALAVPTMLGENMMDVLRAGYVNNQNGGSSWLQCHLAEQRRSWAVGRRLQQAFMFTPFLYTTQTHQNWQHTKHARLKPMQQRTMMKPVEPVTIDIRKTVTEDNSMLKHPRRSLGDLKTGMLMHGEPEQQAAWRSIAASHESHRIQPAQASA